MSIKTLIQDTCRKLGVDLVRFDASHHALARRMMLFKTFAIDHVLDVGANEGQYAEQLRRLGFLGHIESFEPLQRPFALLSAKAANDGLWSAHNFALGDRDEDTYINVASGDQSSSLLPMKRAHIDAAPNIQYVSRQLIKVHRLDSVFLRVAPETGRVLLKLDVQGFEDRVIAGAAKSLERILGVQLEASLVPLYEGETLLCDLVRTMAGAGFTLHNLEPGFSSSRTGQLLQCDCTFFREGAK